MQVKRRFLKSQNLYFSDKVSFTCMGALFWRSKKTCLSMGTGSAFKRIKRKNIARALSNHNPNTTKILQAMVKHGRNKLFSSPLFSFLLFSSLLFFSLLFSSLLFSSLLFSSLLFSSLIYSSRLFSSGLVA